MNNAPIIYSTKHIQYIAFDNGEVIRIKMNTKVPISKCATTDHQEAYYAVNSLKGIIALDKIKMLYPQHLFKERKIAKGLIIKLTQK